MKKRILFGMLVVFFGGLLGSTAFAGAPPSVGESGGPTTVTLESRRVWCRLSASGSFSLTGLFLPKNKAVDDLWDYLTPGVKEEGITSLPHLLGTIGGEVVITPIPKWGIGGLYAYVLGPGIHATRTVTTSPYWYGYWWGGVYYLKYVPGGTWTEHAKVSFPASIYGGILRYTIHEDPAGLAYVEFALGEIKLTEGAAYKYLKENVLIYEVPLSGSDLFYRMGLGIEIKPKTLPGLTFGCDAQFLLAKIKEIKDMYGTVAELPDPYNETVSVDYSGLYIKIYGALAF